MTTIVTKPNSQAYAIYVDGRKIVECPSPETTYNELVKNIGIDTTQVQIIEMDSFPTSIGGAPQGTIVQEIVQEVIAENTTQNTESVDDIIARVNAGIAAPNINKHKAHTERAASVSANTETATVKVDNEPVGNVDVPKLGDLIYVDGLDGILRKITGGVGTVHLVYNANDKVEVATTSVPNPDFDEDDEDSEEFIDKVETGSNILVELEEIPGAYFSWTEIKSRQTELRAKYGYKPACVVK
jgi:hypothetical protein